MEFLYLLLTKAFGINTVLSALMDNRFIMTVLGGIQIHFDDTDAPWKVVDGCVCSERSIGHPMQLKANALFSAK